MTVLSDGGQEGPAVPPRAFEVLPLSSALDSPRTVYSAENCVTASKKKLSQPKTCTLLMYSNCSLCQRLEINAY